MQLYYIKQAGKGEGEDALIYNRFTACKGCIKVCHTHIFHPLHGGFSQTAVKISSVLAPAHTLRREILNDSRGEIEANE